ncbi:MAG: radical SAM protein, partial [Desulfamplus sp.]|nr:radical SAM protein [Desulfamplus sp.]
LGASLGVDLVTHKICSLDCVYCECGSTINLTLERKEYVPYKNVIEELDHYFTNRPAPDYITFSGSGEPTLNSKIGDVIDYIKTKKEFCDSCDSYRGSLKNKIKVAVLTNGTLLNDESVRNALLKADLVMPSLDAASIESFKLINRPHSKINLDSYIQGLVDFRQIYKGKMALEILILPGFNDSKRDLELLKNACCKIKPDVVQLNTLDRPGTLENLIPASRQLLEEIQSVIQSGHILVEIIASSKRQETKAYRNDIESAILETIYRRPSTPEDLASILGLHINEINKYLSTLEQTGRITSVSQQRGIFYHTVKE